MNTLLKTLALVLAAALPVAFSADSLGVALPAAFDFAHVFGAFVVALVLLLVTNDYRTTQRLAVHAAAVRRSSLRLAA